MRNRGKGIRDRGFKGIILFLRGFQWISWDFKGCTRISGDFNEFKYFMESNYFMEFNGNSEIFWKYEVWGDVIELNI